MAFWEDIKGRLDDAGDAFVDKTRKMAKTAQISGMLRDMEKDRDKLYTQLGLMYYEDKYGRMKIKTLEKKLSELKDDDPKKAIISKVLEIKQGELRLLELEEEKKQLKGIIKCPECGNDVTPDSEFCTQCGTRINRNKVVEDADLKPEEKADEQILKDAEETVDKKEDEERPVDEKTED